MDEQTINQFNRLHPRIDALEQFKREAQVKLAIQADCIATLRLALENHAAEAAKRLDDRR